MRLLTTLLVASLASAQSGRAYVTELGRRVLARADQVVIARVVHVHPAFRGVVTARLEIRERLAGYDRNPQLTLLFIEDYVAPDAFRATLESSTVRYERRRKAGLLKYLGDLNKGNLPRAEAELTGARKVDQTRQDAPGSGRRARPIGVRLGKGDEGLFFLRRKEASYAMVGFVSARDPLFEAKLLRLRGVMTIEKTSVLDVRARQAKDFYLAGLEDENVWVRGNSAREIRSLATRYPELFSAKEGRRLARLLFAEREPPIQASLERAVRAIDPDLAMDYAAQQETEARERHAGELLAERQLLLATRDPELRAAGLARLSRRYGRAAIDVLAEHLRDKAAVVREYAAHTLAELGGPSARAPLRIALARESDTQAAMAMIYACGVKTDPKAVRVVAKRLGDKQLERPALHALARIGTETARRMLERHRKGADPTTVELIDLLLREEFAERS